MNYSLHPEAEGDLRDAASFYLEQAGTTTLSLFLIIAVVPTIGPVEGNTTINLVRN
jgi:hypothetical protein